MEIKTKCGVFGCYDTEKIDLNYVVKGLSKQQHRGRESCGISYVDNANSIVTNKTMGLVKELSDTFDFNKSVDLAIGHVRYSTSGSKSNYDVIQPRTSLKKSFSLVHNGNIPNIDSLKKSLGMDIIDEKILEMNDTAVIQWMLENSKTIEEGLMNILWKIPGSFSLIIMTLDSLYCVRDSNGFKPLCYSNIEKNRYLVASESVAINVCFPMTKIIDVKPGELIKINKDGVKQLYKLSVNPFDTKICSFEYIYFMNYKTVSDGILVDSIRYEVGRHLVLRDKLSYPKNTLVIGSPNSGISYGKSYAYYSKMQYSQALRKIKKERTFILPTNGERINKIRKIITVDRSEITGREIILIDDSIVRGNTIKHIIELLKNNGALKVHVKIAFPKIISPCYYGIDFPTYDELIGHKKTNQEIADIIGADSIQYSLPEDIKNIIKTDNGTVCNFCTTDKHELEKYEW